MDRNRTGGAGAIGQGAGMSNLYVKIAKQSTGSLKGKDIDKKLEKSDRLLNFDEDLTRAINYETVNNLQPLGALVLGEVWLEILQIPSSVFLEAEVIGGDFVDTITIYETMDIKKKKVIIGETEFKNCIISRVHRYCRELDGMQAVISEIRFRAEQRKRTLTPYDQTGKKLGNLQSFADLTKGVLTAPKSKKSK